ncbi:methylglyoxal synthase [Curvivirga sp.]|uniref:methylglyoxal synthase n=1 Tax=Curvivirga sp. TaxID=2856848 RepID=UPI003B5C5F2F
MPDIKKIALVAHDGRKPDIIEWCKSNTDILARHKLWGTGTTGKMIHEQTGLEIICLKSGPLGGDQQLGAMIAEGELDILIFFTDPLSSHPHDVDVKALVRISTLYQVAMACNRTTANYIISSPEL